MAHILVVDDEEKMRHLLSMMLGRAGYQVDQAANGLEALNKVRDCPYDLVISDIKMPEMDGLTLLEKLTEEKILCPVVFITAFATIDSAVDAMRRGAIDYITKPFDDKRIQLTIERGLHLSRILAENRELKQRLAEKTGVGEIISASKEMEKIITLARKVAPSDSVVLLHGESGTGKELLARFIHQQSRCGKGRFVPVNCAAISANLVESELFGHEKGSFTGADRMAIGKFEFADGGTLFLDEIGDLPGEAQGKLLRVLQEKKVQRVGGHAEIPVCVRILCATNRNLEKLVQEGRFRQDLYFRINVFPLMPPPLRERKDDIIPLATHFLARLAGGEKIELTDGAKRVLLGHQWPGNVRELANAVERAYILDGDRGCISAATLSFLVQARGQLEAANGFMIPAEGILFDEVEIDFVRQALTMASNNQTAAATLLGLSRARFRVLLARMKGEE
ncbi:MAG: sigma-54 dependent transcriptional regulator [Proteobacteria bacterium]|nr:sigma-54 dependent transcriptional regulator [Pseudomonadota bacterium]MBU1686262.1 sigma-54 dependent transcriptional regulator [Pseudomonadota bacterium]